MIENPIAMPSSGATRMNSPVFRSVGTTSTLGPAAATAAPANPPTSACDEEDGIPPSHVTRFQTIAPTRPAVTTASVIPSGVTTFFPIVFATASGNTRYAMKLKNAAHATAANGESTRVETTVAIE